MGKVTAENIAGNKKERTWSLQLVEDKVLKRLHMRKSIWAKIQIKTVQNLGI